MPYLIHFGCTSSEKVHHNYFSVVEFFHNIFYLPTYEHIYRFYTSGDFRYLYYIYIVEALIKVFERVE